MASSWVTSSECELKDAGHHQIQNQHHGRGQSYFDFEHSLGNRITWEGATRSNKE